MRNALTQAAFSTPLILASACWADCVGGALCQLFNTRSFATDIAGVHALALVVGWRVEGSIDTAVFQWTGAACESGGIGLVGEVTPGTSHRAFGVSADASTIVGTTCNGCGGATAFVWREGQGISPIAGTASALAVSGDGSVIVGVLHSGEAFRWTSASGVLPLGDLVGGPLGSSATDITPDASVIIGYGNDSVRRAVRWVGAGGIEQLGNPPGSAGESVAWAVSDDGSTIVGYVELPTGRSAFRWTETDGMSPLGTLQGHHSSEALDVSADGAVIVGTSSGFSGAVAVLWTEATGLLAIHDLVNPPPSGLTLTHATAVTPDGQVIAGNGQNPGGDTQAWVVRMNCTIVPPVECVADIDGDGDTDVFDAGILIGNFGNMVTPGAFGDLDGDGHITVFDFAILAGDFGCASTSPLQDNTYPGDG